MSKAASYAICKISAQEFDLNSFLKDTTIRNGTEVILI